MTLLVYARRDLLDQTPPPHQPALLLEGSWSDDGATAARWSLDGTMDGQFDWIDGRASDLAERLAGDTQAPAHLGLNIGNPPETADCGVAPAYLHALALRYYLLKLIRVAVFFTDVRPLQPGERIEFVAAEDDRDYAGLIEQLCAAAGADCRIRWFPAKRRRRLAFPRNAIWRRLTERVRRLFTPPLEQSDACKAVLCGNPRLLDPVGRELLTRKCKIWWLYDRFAVKSWLRWQLAGARQLVCDSGKGRKNRLRVRVPSRLEYGDVNLAPAVARWLDERVAEYGTRHTRLIEQIDGHFRRVRPDVLVLDEDATPMARAVVAAGRRYGARSLVVQHGAPCCRFGFAPLAADRIAVWGPSSKETLVRWGVNPEQIRITGAAPIRNVKKIDGHIPRVVAHQCESHAGTDDTRNVHAVSPGYHLSLLMLPPDLPPRILLLATVPPQDERPDAVSLNFNRRTYAEMLRMAMRTIAGIDHAELIVKLHPRAPHDTIVRQVRAEFPKLHCRIVRRGPVEKHLADIDVVLSCGSSAGVEASLAGVPVIGLLPPGSGDFLTREEWGMLGTARRDTELQRLLIEVLIDGWRPPPQPDTDVFAATGGTAAAGIADEVLSLSRASIEDQESTQLDSVKSPLAAKVA